MQIQTIAAAAALAVTFAGGVCATPASAATGAAELRLTFDTWASEGGSCAQQVTFRLMPAATVSAPVPTGTVRLVSEGDTVLGQAAVLGFGTYRVTGVCEPDTSTTHRVSLVYDGDSQYAATSVASPDACPGQPTTPTTDAWHSLVGAGAPQPVFMCHTESGFSIRSRDGRLYPGGGAFCMLPSRWQYGMSAGCSLSLDGDTTRQPTRPSGTIVATVDGAAQDRYTLDGGETQFESDVDTSKLTIGEHQVAITYGGDERWAPVQIYAQAITITKAAPGGRYSVVRWKLRRGQRPVVTVRLSNPFSRAGFAPTGKVSFYLGAHHVFDTRLRSSDKGRRTVKLPAVRWTGSRLLRIVYHGDGRYDRLDSRGRHWFASQQYIKVSK